MFPVGSTVECSWDGKPHIGIVTECPQKYALQKGGPERVWAYWDGTDYPLFIDSNTERTKVTLLYTSINIDVGDLEDDL